MNISAKLLPTFVLAALAGAALRADSGYGAGVQTAFDLGSGNAVVPRVDFVHFNDSTGAGGSSIPVNLSASANVVTVGADYNYFPAGETDQGFYLAGGLGLALATINVTASAPGASTSVTSHQTIVYPEVGAGYQFSFPLGLEIMYKAFNFKDVNLGVQSIPVSYSFNGTLQVGVVVRF